MTVKKYRWKRNDWFSKRLPAWINLRWLGRGHRFRDAEFVLAKLMVDLHERGPDHLVFSGDASALGFPDELDVAAKIFGLENETFLPGIAVPGNHDYTAKDALEGAFEKRFTHWQQGTRIDEQTYPFAQKVGHVWLIGMNSATPNFWPWDASGEIRQAELQRLPKLVDQLDDGPRILVTHYPVCMANGKLEAKTHRLRNVEEVSKVMNEVGIGLWLHGHRHVAYQLQSSPWTEFPIICGGSSTQNGIWSYGEYTISGSQLNAVRRVYDPEKESFRDLETFELTLRVP